MRADATNRESKAMVECIGGDLDSNLVADLVDALKGGVHATHSKVVISHIVSALLCDTRPNQKKMRIIKKSNNAVEPLRR